MRCLIGRGSGWGRRKQLGNQRQSSQYEPGNDSLGPHGSQPHSGKRGQFIGHNPRFVTRSPPDPPGRMESKYGWNVARATSSAVADSVRTQITGSSSSSANTAE